MLPAWGLSLPHLFRPGRACSGHCGQKGAQDLYRKCCRRPKSPSSGGPPRMPQRQGGLMSAFRSGHGRKPTLAPPGHPSASDSKNYIKMLSLSPTHSGSQTSPPAVLPVFPRRLPELLHGLPGLRGEHRLWPPLQGFQVLQGERPVPLLAVPVPFELHPLIAQGSVSRPGLPLHSYDKIPHGHKMEGGP